MPVAMNMCRSMNRRPFLLRCLFCLVLAGLSPECSETLAASACCESMDEEGNFPFSASSCFRVMFYNVENTFDTRHDSLKDDLEYLPESKYQWTPYRYWKKLNALNKVVAAIGEECFPALIGLCEVENDSVLFDLTCRSSLRAMGYRYVMTDAPDRRGVDVALLYLPEKFRMLQHREVTVPSVENGFAPTRNILHVTGQVLSGDTVHVFVVHFPSRRGGTRESTRHRRLAIRTLRAELDRIHTASVRSKILVMGDMNATADEPLLKDVLKVVGSAQRKRMQAGSQEPDGGVLYEVELAGTNRDATEEKRSMKRYLRQIQNRSYQVNGTYRYKGEWETIDHILVSPSLMDAACPFHTADGMRRVFALPFMWEEDKNYGGIQPYRTYLGTFYKGGYSDHFPVLLDFLMR